MQADDALELFEQLKAQHRDVSSKTKSLHDSCERLVSTLMPDACAANDIFTTDDFSSAACLLPLNLPQFSGLMNAFRPDQVSHMQCCFS